MRKYSGLAQWQVWKLLKMKRMRLGSASLEDPCEGTALAASVPGAYHSLQPPLKPVGCPLLRDRHQRQASQWQGSSPVA